MAKLYAKFLSVSNRSHWPTVLAGVIPVALLFWIWSDGLKTWFIGDDFAWLSLIRQVHSPHDVFHALFTPGAEGTIRPWSERGFFMLFESLFGLDSLPFRLCVFLTAAIDAVLIGWIARSITESVTAGAFAAILWVANPALMMAMVWNSAYNQVLCALFLVMATILFIRYSETGRAAFWWWQLVVFVLGFGALEVNVVYPALAGAYVLFAAESGKRRRLVLSLTPLCLISIAYFLIHLRFAPVPKDGPYAIHFDGRILQTLASYWKWSLIPAGHSAPAEIALFCVLTAGLGAFVVWQTAHARQCVWFFAAWFLITIAPVAALPDHRTDYYLTVPVIGLAMLGGFAIAQAFAGVRLLRILATAVLAVYLSLMVVSDLKGARWWLDQSRAARGLILGAAAAQTAHPGKTIVLDGVTSDMFANAIGDAGFTSVGLHEVYLTPESAKQIDPRNYARKLTDVTLEPGVLRHAIAHDQVEIYTEVNDHLKNITSAWEESEWGRLPDGLPRRVDAADPLDAYLLGPEWFAAESGFRWMPRRATVHLAGPKSVNDQLVLEGYCPENQLTAGALNLSVSINETPLVPARLDGPAGNFRRVFSIPQSLIGRDQVEVAISVDRVFRDSAGRDLGLVFGTIAVQQQESRSGPPGNSKSGF